MKAKILKIAGVKTEKEFYKKFPTEEAFMKKHGKELKKADPGASLIPGLESFGGLSKGIKKQDDGTYYSALTDQSYSNAAAKQDMYASNYVESYDKDLEVGSDIYDSLLNSVGPLIGGIMSYEDELKQAKRLGAYSDLANRLQQNTLPQRINKNMLVRPEYQSVDPNQLIPARGTGTNYLAENGTKISDGEIMNVYNPGDLYQDLEYPGNDPMPIADFGTTLGKIGQGLGNVPSGFGSAIGSSIGGGGFKNNSLGQIGEGVGQVAGSVATAITGIPGLDQVGKLALGAIGGAFGAPEAKKAEMNRNKMMTTILAGNQQNYLQSNNAFLKDGGHVSDFGYMSDTWNPQVITKFGNLDVSQVHTFAHDGMPEYRAGGHLKEYTAPSAQAMSTERPEYNSKFAMGGDLEVEQGTIKTLARNPELNNGGDIIEFNGPSHENGGMDTRFGDKRVNVEGNETGFADDNGSFHVLGNMQISKFAAQELGDENFANMKYKKLGKVIGDDQNKQNKIIQNSLSKIDDLDLDDPYEQLTANSMIMNKKAAELKTTKNAAILKKAAMVQDAILTAAEEHGLDPAALAEYKIKKLSKKDQAAEFGKTLKIARNGTVMKFGGKSHLEKFEEFEKTVNASLKKMYPGQNAHIKPLTGGVYNKVGGRDISSQSGIFKKGHSQTPISAHNLNAARDYRIYIGDTEISPQGNEDMYADILWPVAEKLGMYNVGDRDPKTADKNWDPAHIGLAKEGKGTLYKELSEKYPDIFDDPNAKKTIDWIAKNKNADTTIAKHFRLINEAGVGKGVIKNVINNVSEAIDKVSPIGKSTEWAAKAVGEFLDATKSMKDAIITPDKAKGMFNTPNMPSFDWWDSEEEQAAPASDIKPINEPKTKIRPKGQPRNPIVQTSPTSGVVDPKAIKDSWADDGSKWWKPVLGVPTEFTNGDTPPQGDGWDKRNPMEKTWGPGPGIPTTFPSAKTSQDLLGKDYDPGYNEQPFWKPRDFRYTPSGPLTETRTVTEGPSTPAVPAATNVVGKKTGAKPLANVPGGKGKAAVAPVAAAVAPKKVRTVPGQDYLTDGSMPAEEQTQVTPFTKEQLIPELTAADPFATSSVTPIGSAQTASGTTGKNRFGQVFDSLLSNVAPFVRPTNQLGLDPAQLAGEMFALSTNQVEPVSAQSYQPMLTQPINISLQDQMNEVTAQSRAAERLTQGNPALQANIFAQAANAKNKILGEQFRLNQAEQLRAYETNRQTLNDAQLKNLAIYDQQYQRQSQAKSNTKAQALAAINSISDKLAKNKLENKTLSMYENMYNYRFTPQGVAYSVNAPQKFNVPTTGTGATDVDSVIANLDKQKQMIDEAKSKLSSTTKKTNGGIVKAINSL